MAKKWCLLPSKVKEFKEKLVSGEINPVKLAGMTSIERQKFLAGIVGDENAVQVNSLFESKLLLKNQKAGYISWAKKVSGINKTTRQDLLSKIEKLTEGYFDGEKVKDKYIELFGDVPSKNTTTGYMLKKILNTESDSVARSELENRLKSFALTPDQETQFLQDLVNTKLGLDVNIEEANTISKLSEKMTEAQKDYDYKTNKWSNEKSAIEYGANRRALENYVNNIKGEGYSLKKLFQDRKLQFKSEWEENKARALGQLALDTASQISNNIVSIVASVDDSIFGRQGIFNLLTGHPVIWGKAFGKSFGDLVKSFGKENTTDALLAKIYSDPLFMSGEYQKAKIIDTDIEDYPSSLPSRIPLVGKIFKASEAAFVNGSLRMRTELYNLMRNQLVKQGVEITDRQVEGLGKVVNSIGAKGDLGRNNNNSLIKLLMWAPKMLKADLDVLTAHTFSDIPKETRKKAQMNLLKIVVITAIIAVLSNAGDDDKMEIDPTSSDFLKLRVGDTRIGFLRGIPQIITLLARMITGKYKSSTTGEYVDYSSDWGGKSRLDALYDFLRNKAPPSTGAVYDWLDGKDFAGNKPTFTSTLFQKGVPISIQNVVELYKNPSIDRMFGTIADFFGLSSNTYRDANEKSKIIPTDKKISKDDFMTTVSVYAKAIGTDPETAFNRIFSGQKIMQVSDGGIVVVARQDVGDSEAYKKKWVKEHGGDITKMKEVKLDHTIPNKLGGSEDPSNWKIVPTAVWSSYTSTENALIKAVKEKKISLKDAQKLIIEFKNIDDTAKRKLKGQEIRNKYK